MITHTLNFDSIVTANGIDGWVFDANPETWIIAPGVIVFSETQYGVDSGGFANNTLINEGSIYAAAQFAGVRLNLGNGTVVNRSGAEIFGARNGVDLLGSGSQTLDNFGKIVAADNNGVFFGNNTLGVSVVNHGYIFGAAFGVENASKHVGGTIDNFGIIRTGSITTVDESDPAAISIYTLPTLVTNIFNATGAVLKGAINSIYANTGMFHLVNHGTIIGNILDFSEGNDIIINPGKIKGAIYLEGNSIFNGSGGSSGAIHVGDGNATVRGGSGVDHFVFDSPITGQVTNITHFQHGIDKIVLSESVFSALGAGAIGHALPAADFFPGSANPATEYIVYHRATGSLFYDSNGSGGPLVQFATLVGHPLLSHADFLVEA